MKLQLSVFAEGLSGFGGNLFAVVAQIHSETNKKPTPIGKTEVIKNTAEPDWTKVFILEDFELGKPMYILITIRDKNAQSNLGANKGVGSAKFEIGSILGSPGSMLGKQLKTGGM